MAALQANGGGDLIVNPQFEVKKHRKFFGTKVEYVVVSGHVATYKNVHLMTQSEADLIMSLKGKIGVATPIGHFSAFVYLPAASQKRT